VRLLSSLIFRQNFGVVILMLSKITLGLLLSIAYITWGSIAQA
jgi:hypothetical protein